MVTCEASGRVLLGFGDVGKVTSGLGIGGEDISSPEESNCTCSGHSLSPWIRAAQVL